MPATSIFSAYSYWVNHSTSDFSKTLGFIESLRFDFKISMKTSVYYSIKNFFYSLQQKPGKYLVRAFGAASGGYIGAGYGAMLGGIIGSVVPVIGTAVGAVIGGIIGGGFSAWAGQKLVKHAFRGYWKALTGDTNPRKWALPQNHDTYSYDDQFNSHIKYSNDQGGESKPLPVIIDEKNTSFCRIVVPGEDIASRDIMDAIYHAKKTANTAGKLKLNCLLGKVKKRQLKITYELEEGILERRGVTMKDEESQRTLISIKNLGFFSSQKYPYSGRATNLYNKKACIRAG